MCPPAPSASWRAPISPLVFSLGALFIIDLLLTAARAGLLNARASRLASLRDERGKQAESALLLVTRRTVVRDSLRLSLALLRFLMAGLVLDLLIPAAQNAPTLINLAILLLIGLGIWLAEFFVERHILRDAETWAMRFAWLGRGAVMLMSPVVSLLNRFLDRSAENRQLVTITEAELRSFVDTSQRQGVLEQGERRMIFSIFKFGDTLAREIMVPRIDIFAIDVEASVEDAADALIESGYSRVPVYKNNIDDIQGLLYGKDLLKVWRKPEVKSLRELLRPAYFVPESKKLDELLAEMQSRRIHLGIVVDEYGGVAGLVTLEDLVEEIVGEIQDEYDLGEEQSYQKVSDGEYLFRGRIPLDEFNEVMASHLSTAEADTLGGYLFHRLGRLPKQGETFTEDGLLFTIENITGRRIRRVRAQRTKTAAPPPKKKEIHAK